MPQYIQSELPLSPLVYTLAGYLVLQIVLNLINAAYVKRLQSPVAFIKASFWSSVVNSVYFLAVAVVLHVLDLAPNTAGPPPNMLWWALAGLPLGVLLWWLIALGRRAGMLLFGASTLVASEDAVLRFPPGPQYLTWGMANLSLIAPLGRELFMRGVFLPVVVFNLGWGWGIGATLVIEFLLRLNVVWAPATAVYGLFMCGLFYLSGNALCGLVAASVAGFIHGLAWLKIMVNKEKERLESKQVELLKTVGGTSCDNGDAGD